LAVSALDYFIHELTRIGMLESWVGTRAQTDALQRYQLPLSIAIGSIERRRGPVERQFPPERPVRLHRQPRAGVGQQYALGDATRDVSIVLTAVVRENSQPS
jgi:hypothetical protein